MNLDQMKIRCPDSIFIRRVFLTGYRFVYDGKSYSRRGGVANIVKSAEDIVWGGLFEITESCLKNLDEYEGYPSFYNRKEFQVQDDERNFFNAIAYYRTGKVPSEPSSSYRQEVIQGARDCGLPEEYIKENL